MPEAKGPAPRRLGCHQRAALNRNVDGGIFTGLIRGGSAGEARCVHGGLFPTSGVASRTRHTGPRRSANFALPRTLHSDLRDKPRQPLLVVQVRRRVRLVRWHRDLTQARAGAAQQPAPCEVSLRIPCDQLWPLSCALSSLPCFQRC